MTAPAPFRTPDLARALAAVRKAGLPVARVVVRRDGVSVEIGDSGEKPKATVDASLPEPRL